MGLIMKADERRNAIMGILIKEKRAIKGTTLAENFNVTRQIIVKDIAILRAKGNNIIATPDGYMINDDNTVALVLDVIDKSSNYVFIPLSENINLELYLTIKKSRVHEKKINLFKEYFLKNCVQ